MTLTKPHCAQVYYVWLVNGKFQNFIEMGLLFICHENRTKLFVNLE